MVGAHVRSGYRSLYYIGTVCAIGAFISMFIAFSTPYWIQSWRRVHSPFANTGLWHMCLSGYIKPMDPALSAYVGCWWIHSSVYAEIANDIMPAWFRVVQALAVFTFIIDLLVMILLILYKPHGSRRALYGERAYRLLLGNAIISFLSAALIFIDSLIFAEKAFDGVWIPRPVMNYLSWSYGFNLLSGFFIAFTGISTSLMAMMARDGFGMDDGGENVGSILAPPPGTHLTTYAYKGSKESSLDTPPVPRFDAQAMPSKEAEAKAYQSRADQYRPGYNQPYAQTAAYQRPTYSPTVTLNDSNDTEV